MSIGLSSSRLADKGWLSDVGTLTYRDYLRLTTLLDMQNVRGGPTDSQVGVAEHFFIVLHQSTELWFKQMGKDLKLTIECLDSENDPASLILARALIGRATATFGLLTNHLALMDRHLAREDFSAFRGALDTASGVQSSQFRELSRLLGVRVAGDGPLLSAFLRRVEQDGFTVKALFNPAEEVPASYRDVADELLHLGNSYYQWLSVHLTLVSSMIGIDRGTAGSSGVEFLLSRLEMPFAGLRDAVAYPRP